MHGTVYYYYDKVLVTNCKFRTLEPYGGKIARGSAVQLLYYPLETENAPLSAPAGISADGDFYLAALSEDVIYQIHKNGTLIRVYASSVSRVEETVMGVPMSILAMLQGKFLLHGSLVSAQDSVYAVLGDEEVLKHSGLSGKDMILLENGRIDVPGEAEGYQGMLQSCCGDKNKVFWYQTAISRIKQVLVLENSSRETNMELIAETVTKEHLLLKYLVGFLTFSQELQGHIRKGSFLREAGQKLPMAALRLPEDYKVQEYMENYVLNVDKTD